MNAIYRQAKHVTITTIIIVVCMIIAILLATQPEEPPSYALEMIIFMTGTLGGVANNFRRLQRIPLDVLDKDFGAVPDRLVTIQLYVSPIVGGVFAGVLYIIFMSGIIQGSFFPAFGEGLNQDYESFDLFAKLADPKTNADVAKAILWAFVAGFSEGFVPNFIDKVAKEAIKP